MNLVDPLGLEGRIGIVIQHYGQRERDRLHDLRNAEGWIESGPHGGVLIVIEVDKDGTPKVKEFDDPKPKPTGRTGRKKKLLYEFIPPKNPKKPKPKRRRGSPRPNPKAEKGPKKTSPPERGAHVMVGGHGAPSGPKGPRKNNA